MTIGRGDTYGSSTHSSGVQGIKEKVTGRDDNYGSSTSRGDTYGSSTGSGLTGSGRDDYGSSSEY